MPKNCLFAAVVAGACIVSSVACSKSSDDEATATPGPDPVIGPIDRPPPPPPGTEGGIPVFDFPNPGTPADDGGAIADAGADVQPIDNDPGAAQGPRVWGVDTGGRLVSFRVNAPAMVSVKFITGLAPGETLLAADFRPANGAMYGLGSSSRLYTVNLTTGAATPIGDGMPFTPALHGQAQGFDVNPAADKIRLHTDTDQNLRLDPITGKVVPGGVDGTLAFMTGDVNAGQSPNIVGTAYTNNVTPAPATTMLYAIDSTRNLLTRVPVPNDGMVATVGPLGIDIDEAGGFDIAKNGTPYAVLRVGAETGLYTIDLTTGAATKLGVVAYPRALRSISLEP